MAKKQRSGPAEQARRAVCIKSKMFRCSEKKKCHLLQSSREDKHFNMLEKNWTDMSTRLSRTLMQTEKQHTLAVGGCPLMPHFLKPEHLPGMRPLALCRGLLGLSLLDRLSGSWLEDCVLGGY